MLRTTETPAMSDLRRELFFRLHVQTATDGNQTLVEREDPDLELGEEVFVHALRPEVFAVEPVHVYHATTLLEGQDVRWESEPVPLGGTFYVGGETYDLVGDLTSVDPKKVATLQYFKDRGYSKVIQDSSGGWSKFNEGDQVISRPSPQTV